MNLIECLEKQGFFNIKVYEPGSIQVCANHSSGVGIWFYSKHVIASLSIYSTQWSWPNQGEIDLYQIWDWMKGDELECFELPVEDDMGGLLSAEEISALFNEMWSKYLKQNS